MINDIKIIKANLNNPLHCQAEIELMRSYMEDKMGGVQPHDKTGNYRLISGLKENPCTLIFLAMEGNRYVGLTNGFVNFATFAAKKFLNIHDVIVSHEYRGRGIGKMLLEKNVKWALEKLECAKVTLEVREDNTVAKSLYKSLGFEDSTPPMLYWTKIF